MENTIIAEKAALVLVDMQVLAVKAFAASTPDLVPNTVAMVDFCHENKIPVIYTKLERRPDLRDIVSLCTDSALASKDPDNKGGSIFLEGGEDGAIIPELPLIPEDFLVIKKRQGAFYGSLLELYLRSLQVDTILFGGVATQFGVEGIVRVARDMDFNCVVLSDCCAAPTVESHEYPLKNIFPNMARVMTSKQAREITIVSTK